MCVTHDELAFHTAGATIMPRPSSSAVRLRSNALLISRDLRLEQVLAAVLISLISLLPITVHRLTCLTA